MEVLGELHLWIQDVLLCYELLEVRSYQLGAGQLWLGILVISEVFLRPYNDGILVSLINGIAELFNRYCLTPYVVDVN